MQRRKGNERSVLGEYIAQLRHSGSVDLDPQVRARALQHALALAPASSAASPSAQAAAGAAQPLADASAASSGAPDAGATARPASRGMQAMLEHVASSPLRHIGAEGLYTVQSAQGLPAPPAGVGPDARIGSTSHPVPQPHARAAMVTYSDSPAHAARGATPADQDQDGLADVPDTSQVRSARACV